MTLLVKILLITASYLPNNGNLSNHLAYFSPGYFSTEIIQGSLEDVTTESYISSFNQESKQEKNINLHIYSNDVVQKSGTTPLQINFLYRLLPFLIDQPPPSC